MICIPLNKKKTADLLKSFKEANEIGDIIEIWFDSITDLTDENLKEIFKHKSKPLLFKSLGQQDLLKRLAAFPLEYLDLDLATPAKTLTLARKLFPKTKLILSHHDFKKMPSVSSLTTIFKKMVTKGADIKKIAVTTNKFTESITLLSLAKKLSTEGHKVIFIGMGKEGRLTRTAGHLCGNYLMYCPLTAKESTAPGQVSAKELKEIMKLTV